MEIPISVAGYSVSLDYQLGWLKGWNLCNLYLEYQAVDMYLFLLLQDLVEAAADDVPFFLHSMAYFFFHIQVHRFGQEAQALTRHMT